MALDGLSTEEAFTLASKARADPVNITVKWVCRSEPRFLKALLSNMVQG
jgi:hypothetical protein